VDLRQACETILSHLDVRAEAEALGVEFAAASPSPRGWLPCRAVGRVDRNPSAAINVGSDGLRGIYRDLGGLEGRATSFFDLAVTTERPGRPRRVVPSEIGPPPRRPACLRCPEVPMATGLQYRVVLLVPRGSPGRFERPRRPAALRCRAKSVKKNARGFFLARWGEVLGSRKKLQGKDLQKQKRCGLLECSCEDVRNSLAGGKQ
jgi:hypothetical protein